MQVLSSNKQSRSKERKQISGINDMIININNIH